MNKLCVVAPMALIFGYGASPFVSLYEMGQAVRHDKVRTLCADIDWDSVRDGLRQDIADGIAGGPVETASATNNPDDLPPFGSSFVSNMAGNVVDHTVTPQHLAETMHAMKNAGAMPNPHVQNAYFVGPATFIVTVFQGASRTTEPIKLRLDLVRQGWSLRWKVTRAWLPEKMLEQSQTHSS